MMRLVWAVIAILLFQSSMSAQSAKAVRGCSDKNGLTQAEITEILDGHNKPRAELQLPTLSWDCKLAKGAQEWADRGIFEHHIGYKYGESLYVSSRPNTNTRAAVQQWMLEKGSWNVKAATCAPGKTCSHYTQIVWRRTATIGCGINRNASGKWRLLLVCSYDPPGNGPGPPY